MMHTESKTRIDIRLPEGNLMALKKRADLAKQPLAAYGREILLRSLEESSPEHEELVNRMINLEETISELKTILLAQSDKLVRLTMAALASSAMLRDDGRGSDEEANAKILSHIAESIAASPGILKIHQNALT